MDLRTAILGFFLVASAGAAAAQEKGAPPFAARLLGLLDHEDRRVRIGAMRLAARHLEIDHPRLARFALECIGAADRRVALAGLECLAAFDISCLDREKLVGELQYHYFSEDKHRSWAAAVAIAETGLKEFVPWTRREIGRGRGGWFHQGFFHVLAGLGGAAERDFVHSYLQKRGSAGLNRLALPLFAGATEKRYLEHLLGVLADLGPTTDPVRHRLAAQIILGIDPGCPAARRALESNPYDRESYRGRRVREFFAHATPTPADFAALVAEARQYRVVFLAESHRPDARALDYPVSGRPSGR